MDVTIGMVLWTVKFNHGSNLLEELKDARSYEMDMGPWFVESLYDGVRSNGKYNAKALGMEHVLDPEGNSKDQNRYFFVKVKKNNDFVKFLFQLNGGDSCSLVGISDGIARYDAEETLLSVADGKASGVELAI